MYQFNHKHGKRGMTVYYEVSNNVTCNEYVKLPIDLLDVITYDDIVEAAAKDWKERDCEHNHVDELLCGTCNGSGEGMRDGTYCVSCNGSGEGGNICSECGEGV